MKHTIKDLKLFMAMKSLDARVIPVDFFKKYDSRIFKQECIEDIEEILDRATPMKPHVIDNNVGFDGMDYYCNFCGHFLHRRHEQQFCDYCGREVDRSDYE